MVLVLVQASHNASAAGPLIDAPPAPVPGPVPVPGPCPVDAPLARMLGPCPPDPTLLPPRCPIYVQIEALILQRVIFERTEVASQGLLPASRSPDIVFSTGELNEPMKAGARFLIGYTVPNSPFQVELSGFALDGSNTDAAIRDRTINEFGTEGNLFSPLTNWGDPPEEGVDYQNLVSIREYSSLAGGELNFMRLLPTPPGVVPTSLFVGIRHLRIREQFDYLSQTLVPAPVGAINSVDTRTSNELWGPQLGALMYSHIGDRCWIHLGVKGAICNNAASQQTTYVNLSQTPVLAQHQRSVDVTALVGDIQFTIVHRWTPGFATRIGYQAMWIQGLALAAENFSPPLDTLIFGPGWIDHGGRAVYHGLHAGIELAW